MPFGEAGEGLSNFRSYILNDITEAGYKLVQGELWINSTHLTGYNQGDYPGDIFRFDLEPNKGSLELQVGGKTSPQDETTLERWLSEARGNQYIVPV